MRKPPFRPCFSRQSSGTHFNCVSFHGEFQLGGLTGTVDSSMP
ncbi:hypothetical protein [Myxococcus landrumensis]|nr:hypothetical protein [Myxococcus landrumus]